MSRSSRHVTRDRITSSRLSRSLAAARHLFFAGYQKQPRHRAADVLKATRIVFWRSLEYLFLSLLSTSHSLLLSSLPRFSPVFLFSIFSLPSLATLLTLSRSCVSYVRTNSISRDSLRLGRVVNCFSSSRFRSALLRTCASSSLPSRFSRFLTPRTPDWPLSSLSL